MEQTQWLSEPESRAWRGYLRMRALLDLRISRDLSTDSGLSDADYHVLATLSAAPDERLRLINLAGTMLWSTSRLTHHLDRMQRRDLITREALPDNSRAAVVALTAGGRTAITNAAPLHVESVRRHFIGLLSHEQLRVLADSAETVVTHLLESDASSPAGTPPIPAT
jgi:DNA-binding MarR family transcriptional regulator